MGQGCTLRTNLYFSHKTYQSIIEVEDEIELKEKIIENNKKELMMLMVMTEPAKFWRESEAEVGETPFIWMQNQASSLIESIIDETYELADLYRLKVDWYECHDKDGKAIEPPKGEEHSTPYFWGDWIDSVYPDGTEAHNTKNIF